MGTGSGRKLRKGGWLSLRLLPVLLGALLGAYMAAGYGCDDRSEAWFRWHREVIRAQLGDLETHLQDYNKAHGRYPTNDEGLGALDNFAARFKVEMYCDPASRRPSRLVVGRFFWERIRRTLREFREAFGRAPAGANEQERLRLWRYMVLGRTQGLEAVDVEVAIGKGDNLFLISPEGVLLSPYQIPYVYENRAGHDPRAFADSPASRDEKREFSVRVDEGVYVSSVGGEFCARQEKRLWWKRAVPRMVGVAFVVAAVVGLVLMFRGKALIVGLLALVGSAGAGVSLEMGSYVTCYIMAPLFSLRDPAMVVRQKELLDKYRSAGVISAATYEKVLSAMEPGAATRPATAPAEDN